MLEARPWAVGRGLDPLRLKGGARWEFASLLRSGSGSFQLLKTSRPTARGRLVVSATRLHPRGSSEEDEDGQRGISIPPVPCRQLGSA